MVKSLGTVAKATRAVPRTATLRIAEALREAVLSDHYAEAAALRSHIFNAEAYLAALIEQRESGANSETRPLRTPP